MSTLSTLTFFILCVTAFFNAQTIVSSETLDGDTVIGQIDQAIEKINKRTTQLYRRVVDLGPQDADEKFSVIVPFIQKAYQHISTLESFVNNFINLKDERNFNETECRSYFDKYKKEFDEAVLGSMASAPYNVFRASVLSIGQLLHVAYEDKITLNNLKAQVNDCNTTECNDISRNVEIICTRFLTAAGKTQNYYAGMVNGLGIVKTLKNQTNWDYNFNKGQEVLREVYECVHKTPSNELYRY